jgi:NAD(P)-dependent dehydrogenase (short-subunit alcohol dehydrogenase family)
MEADPADWDRALKVNLTIYQELLQNFDGDMDRMRAERSQRVPAGRMGTAWDVARTALYLVSDQADYVTGQIIAGAGAIGNRIIKYK